MTTSRDIEKALEADGGPGNGAPASAVLLSTGSTLLNLACTGSPYGGFIPGRYYYLVGDSTSGKTFLSMTCLAEATVDKAFDGYRFIYDNIEDGCLLDLPRLFNEEVERRIEPPRGTMIAPQYSSTIEEFYDNLSDLTEAGVPFIYILDSMDALTSEAETGKVEQQKRDRRKGREVTGSYGDGKAKVNSGNLRRILRGLKETGSILIIISQTRDNLGFGYEKKTRSGGHALKFYATIEIWSSVKTQLKRTVRGKPRTIGVLVQLRLRKNRVTGLTPTVQIPIYPSYGMDDTQSCVNYLIDEGWWKKSGKGIVATGTGLVAHKAKLPALIEEKRKVRKMRRQVAKCWRSIVQASALKRKSRYK